MPVGNGKLSFGAQIRMRLLLTLDLILAVQASTTWQWLSALMPYSTSTKMASYQETPIPHLRESNWTLLHNQTYLLLVYVIANGSDDE